MAYGIHIIIISYPGHKRDEKVNFFFFFFNGLLLSLEGYGNRSFLLFCFLFSRCFRVWGLTQGRSSGVRGQGIRGFSSLRMEDPAGLGQIPDNPLFGFGGQRQGKGEGFPV